MVLVGRGPHRLVTTLYKALYGKRAPQCRTGRVMKSSIFLLVLASATAAPQFEGLKDIFSALSGDDEAGEVNGDYEQVPYTTLKQFDVGVYYITIR